MFPLELNVDRVVSLSGLQRLTVPSTDWIAAHRPHPRPPLTFVAVPGFAEAKTRYAPSNDLLVQRYEAAQVASGSSCGHSGHRPCQPGAPARTDRRDRRRGPVGNREGYRATVRQADGAFTERHGVRHLRRRGLHRPGRRDGRGHGMVGGRQLAISSRPRTAGAGTTRPVGIATGTICRRTPRSTCGTRRPPASRLASGVAPRSPKRSFARSRSTGAAMRSSCGRVSDRPRPNSDVRPSRWRGRRC